MVSVAPVSLNMSEWPYLYSCNGSCMGSDNLTFNVALKKVSPVCIFWKWSSRSAGKSTIDLFEGDVIYTCLPFALDALINRCVMPTLNSFLDTNVTNLFFLRTGVNTWKYSNNLIKSEGWWDDLQHINEGIYMYIIVTNVNTYFVW